MVYKHVYHNGEDLLHLISLSCSRKVSANAIMLNIDERYGKLTGYDERFKGS